MSGRVLITFTARFEVTFEADCSADVVKQLDAGVDPRELDDVNSIEDAAFAQLRRNGTCEIKWSRLKKFQER